MSTADCRLPNEDLFQRAKRLAISPKQKSRSRRSDRLEKQLRQMTGELEKNRVLHWEYFRDRFGWSDRTCRDVANFSEGHIISFSGGYVLNKNAQPEEFAEANGRIRSQGEKMLTRADRELRVREELMGATA